MTRTNGLGKLFPELYPVIASHLPLYITPSTLLSLALVNHHISAIVLPLLYSRLLLKTEQDASTMFQRLLDKPELGVCVRELHSLVDPKGSHFDRLYQVISNGLLPNIHTLDLQLLSGYFLTDSATIAPRPERLRVDFWLGLKMSCPGLRGLILRNFPEYAAFGMNNPSSWTEECGSLLELQGITDLKLIFDLCTTPKKVFDILLRDVEYLSPHLHTLDLEPGCTEGPICASSLVSFNFPQLRSFSLGGFTLSDTSKAMEFWKRHPKLEHLRIISEDDTCWFAKGSVFEDFLPNLRHLKAKFDDVRSLAPILNRLISLTIYNTINAQVPYLLRSILPNGLLNLKSLKISQTPIENYELGDEDESTRWYETELGDFCLALPGQELEEASRDVTNGYIHSISRGAPNIEEICLHGNTVLIQRYAEIASEIGLFRNLRRFYFQGNQGTVTDEERTIMIEGTKALAEACGQLTMVVNLAWAWELPYEAARITRSENGEVIGVDLGKCYYGVQIGNEDEAFPQSC